MFKNKATPNCISAHIVRHPEFSSVRHPELDSGSPKVRFRSEFGMTVLLLQYVIPNCMSVRHPELDSGSPKMRLINHCSNTAVTKHFY